MKTVVLYLANAFSIGMLSELAGRQITIVMIREITIEEAKEMVANRDFKSIVGHESTAKLATQLLGIPVACHREAIQLQPGDELIVIQVLQRLPEGKVLGEKELQQLLDQEKIKFYHIRILS